MDKKQFADADADAVDRATADGGTNTRAAGLMLLAAAVASIAFVALDPQVDGATTRALLEGVAAAAPMHRLVHAVELACVLGLAFGFASLATRLGPRRPAVLGACVAYLAGCVAMVGAATTDGFVTGDIASYYLRPGHSIETGREMLHLAYAVIQDLGTVAWFFQSVGVIAMAVALLRERGLRRTVGALGLATGALPPIVIVATYPAMDTGVVLGVLGAQLVWNVAAAVLLLRSDRPASSIPDAVPTMIAA